MSSWEYKVIRVDSIINAIKIHSELVQAGIDGWELVSVIQLSNNAIIHYFKRPKYD